MYLYSKNVDLNVCIKIVFFYFQVTGHGQGETGMAHLTSNQAYLQQTLDREFLNCGICLGRYSNPKILPCLHTFCQVIINSKVQTYAVYLWASCPGQTQTSQLSDASATFRRKLHLSKMSPCPDLYPNIVDRGNSY